MLALSPYIRLMRLNAPVGIWLLLWPCWWALVLAAPHVPYGLLCWFGAGAVLMRSAGCIINDMADRTFDAQVERTKNRPLASGELSMLQAGVLLAALLGASLLIALQLGQAVLLWAGLSLLPVVLYPFMKRISWWPQLFLGLTFNWGALMGFAAMQQQVGLAALALYIGGMCWTLGYDTIYAHQDKRDDAAIGVRSTALRLGAATKPAVAGFYALALLGWGAAMLLAGRPAWQLVLLVPVAVQMVWQIKAVQLDEPASCREIFISNAKLGWLVLAAFAAGLV